MFITKYSTGSPNVFQRSPIHTLWDEALQIPGRRPCESKDVYNDLNLLRGTDGEGDGTPLQYSCLENPMDGGAW